MQDRNSPTATPSDESERTRFMRWWDKFRHTIGDEEAASFSAWSAWLERGRLDEIAPSADGRSLPELKESLYFTRLENGDRRALYAEHQHIFDAYYSALDKVNALPSTVAAASGETPRTDAACFKAYREDGMPLLNYVVDGLFACQLERELAEAQAELERRQAKIMKLTSVPSSTAGSEKNIIRRNGDGTLDEVFCEPCQLHLEQMAGGHWWIGILVGDGVFHHINLHAKGKITARIETETHEGDRVAPSATERTSDTARMEYLFDVMFTDEGDAASKLDRIRRTVDQAIERRSSSTGSDK